MRIRKHARISPLLYTASSLNPGAVIQTHVCQLNQSPWDVMTFSPPSSPPPPLQVDGSDVRGGNGSCSSVTEREVSSPRRRSEYSVAGMEFAEESEDDTTPPPAAAAKNEVITCCKTDGKSWQCRREAAEGNSLCSHHLSMVKSYNGAGLAAKKSVKPAAETRRSKKAPASSSSNPYEFYYYSGFGPRWSKRRGETRKSSDGAVEVEAAPPPLSHIAHEDFNFVEYEEDEEDEEEEESRDNGRKRLRKPIKARSLKSLL